jgi:hypothetical protein
VDHETALEAANQALSGNERSANRITSVTLERIDPKRRTGRSLPDLDATPERSREALQIAAMLTVGGLTLLLVASLWLL